MQSIFKILVKKKEVSKKEEERHCTESGLKKLGFSGFPTLDMLRYDGGKIIEVKNDGFIVEATIFTKQRWESFGADVELLNTTKLKDKEAQQKIDENRLWFAELSEGIYNHCEEVVGKGMDTTGSELNIRDAKDIIKKLKTKK